MQKLKLLKAQTNVKGAKRVLTLQDGGKINETLTAYNAKKSRMSYKITESVLPVSDYTATFKVIAMGKSKSKVVWNAAFKRVDQAARQLKVKMMQQQLKPLLACFVVV